MNFDKKVNVEKNSGWVGAGEVVGGSGVAISELYVQKPKNPNLNNI